jgi:hypothetical protein
VCDLEAVGDIKIYIQCCTFREDVEPVNDLVLTCK